MMEDYVDSRDLDTPDFIQMGKTSNAVRITYLAGGHRHQLIWVKMLVEVQHLHAHPLELQASQIPTQATSVHL